MWSETISHQNEFSNWSLTEVDANNCHIEKPQKSEISNIIHEDCVYISKVTGNLQKYSTKTGRLVKDYGQIHEGAIWSMAITNNLQFLFTSDYLGFMNKIDLITGEVAHSFGRCHMGFILSIELTSCNRFLYSTGFGGNLKKWCAESGKLLIDYGKVSKTRIWSLLSTPNGLELFAGDNDGVLQCLEIKEEKKSKTSIFFTEKVLPGAIRSLAVTPDSRYLYIAGWKGYLKKLDIYEKAVIKDFDLVHDGSVWCMEVSKCGAYLYACDHKGGLTVWSTSKNCIINKFAKLHNTVIYC